MNIIIGSNGSGKSAILAAIMLVLGGRATVTNRATNVCDLIKTGESSAQITIQLDNSGINCFDSDKYGKSITVVRRILASGGGYTLLNEDMEIVTASKDELNLILDHFYIHVTNPVCILTQDISRKFISSAKDTEKYEIFSDATSLTEMDEKIKENTQQLVDARVAAHHKQIEHDNFQESVKLLKEEIELAQERAILLQRVQDLQLQLNWSILREHEKEVESAELKAASLIEVKDNLTNHICTENEKLSSALNGLKKMEQQETMVSTNLQEIVWTRKNLENSINKHEAQVHGLQKRKQQKTVESESAEKTFRSMQQKIENIKKTSQDKKQKEEVRILELISQHESNIRAINQELNEIESEMTEFKTTINSKKEEKSKLSSELNNINNNYRKLLERYNRTLSNDAKFASFPLWTAKLDTLIDQCYKNGVFHERPIGPIGSVISLRDYNWAVAVEACLKQSLFEYCVCDHHDKAELLKLMTRVCERTKFPNLVIFPFKRSIYDTRSSRPDVEFPTILDILNCAYPQIINMLIDTAMVEKIICFKDSKVAQDIMLNRPPRNVAKAFTIEGDEYLVTRYHNCSRFYSGRWRKARIFIEDLDAELRDLRNKLENIKQNEQKVKLNIETVNESMNSIIEHLNSLSRMQSEKKREINNLNLNVSDLNVQLKRVQVSSNVSELEYELDEISKNLEKLLNEKTECDQQIEELLTIINSNRVEIDRLTSEGRDLNEQIAELTKASMSFNMQIKHINEFSTEKKKELYMINSRISVEQSNLEKIRDISIQLRTNLLSKGQEVPLEENDTPDVLRREITVLSHRLSQTNVNLTQEKLDEMKLTYEKDNHKLMEVSSTIEKLSEVIIKLDEDLPNRVQKYESLKASVTSKISKNFERVLTYRGFSGSLEIDHNKRCLKIRVNKAAGDESKLQDLKGLSGGERSFATLALIISIWETMDSPFRCMDEFDVFMDSVNRTVCFGLLKDYTNNHNKNQVIIFTPQDIKGISIPEETSILKMD